MGLGNLRKPSVRGRSRTSRLEPTSRDARAYPVIPAAWHWYPIFFHIETCSSDRACDTHRIRLIGGLFHLKARMVARRSDLPGVSAFVCR